MPVFEQMYAAGGRRSVPPETLLKSTVLMAMYSIRSERAFCERLNYDLLFKWFLDMRIDQPAFDATTFTKNRKRLLEHEVADEFFAAVVRQAKLRRYISSEHFSVDGTLLKAWASHKSFKPKDGPPIGAAGWPQRRGAVARREALERHPRLDDRPGGQAVSQEQQHRRHALLRRAPVDGAPLSVDRRRRADHRRRLRRAGHRDRDARPAPQDRRGGARSLATRATTRRASSPTPASSGSPRTSPRTRAGTGDQRSTAERPDTPATR